MRIRNGKLVPGDRLPAERDLVCAFDVSRAAAQAAMLQHLENAEAAIRSAR